MPSNIPYKAILKHLIVSFGFVVASLLYFNPVLKGKAIFQSDIQQYLGMAKQQNDYRIETGEETYWTNSAFGGMPTYQLGARYTHNYIKILDQTLRFLPRPADYLFLYLFGFYILMLTLKVDFKLAALGALAFGFSTYLIIILGVGHNSKAHAIAYMPLVLSGILLVFQKRYIFGGLLTTIALGLELSANHFQMTYYLLLAVVVLAVVFFIEAVKTKRVLLFFKTLAILIIPVVLAIGLNATNILATQEYSQFSTRGSTDLTLNADGTVKEKLDGLNKDYITEYSYGFLESFNLFIPRFVGGGSYEDVGKNSETYNFYRQIGASPVQAAQAVKQTPTYWGAQPIVEAPAYVGAILIFLFILSLFLVKGKLKWWLVSAIGLSYVLSLGKNFGVLTDIFIDYMPLYDKFRAVSSIQVILELAIPVLAVLGLKQLFDTANSNTDKIKALKYATFITAGLALFFLVFKTAFFDFSGVNDDYFAQSYGPEFIDALKKDRIQLFNADAMRSFVLVLLSAGTLGLYLAKKINANRTVFVLAVLIVFDLVGVDRRYVNNDDFVSKSTIENPFSPTQQDLQILDDSSYFRVFDATSSGSKASYFHNSVGGYHAAKLGRFNELNEFYIQNNKLSVLNMLNVKYIISQDENGQPKSYLNAQSNSPAWFVSNLIGLPSANAEMISLDTLNTKTNAVFDKSVFNESKAKPFVVDSAASITIETVAPNRLTYKSKNSNDGFAVFSEIYYPKGWKVTIDGAAVDHVRVNYTLRGLQIPKGEHEIQFEFDPDVVKLGSKLSLASSVLVALIALLLLIGVFKPKRQNP